MAGPALTDLYWLGYYRPDAVTPILVGFAIYDSGNDLGEIRMLPDYGNIATDEDIEVLQATPSYFWELSNEMGMLPFITWIKDALSNAIYITHMQLPIHPRSITDYANALEKQLFDK